jgi:hypothetical protein
LLAEAFKKTVIGINASRDPTNIQAKARCLFIYLSRFRRNVRFMAARAVVFENIRKTIDQSDWLGASKQIRSMS